MGTQRLKHGTQRFSRTWYPYVLKKPSKPELWILFPPDSSHPSFPSTRPEVYEVRTKALKTFNWGKFPWALPVGSIFPSTFKAQYGKVAWKMSSSASYLGAAWTVVDPPGGVWWGELSHDASRWSEKFKRIPRRFEEVKKNLYGRDICKEYVQTGPLQLFFFLFSRGKHWIIYGVFQQKRNAAIRGGEGWWFRLEWFWVWVVNRRSVYFRFY